MLEISTLNTHINGSIFGKIEMHMTLIPLSRKTLNVVPPSKMGLFLLKLKYTNRTCWCNQDSIGKSVPLVLFYLYSHNFFVLGVK